MLIEIFVDPLVNVRFEPANAAGAQLNWAGKSPAEFLNKLMILVGPFDRKPRKSVRLGETLLNPVSNNRITNIVTEKRAGRLS